MRYEKYLFFVPCYSVILEIQIYNGSYLFVKKMHVRILVIIVLSIVLYMSTNLNLRRGQNILLATKYLTTFSTRPDTWFLRIYLLH